MKTIIKHTLILLLISMCLSCAAKRKRPSYLGYTESARLLYEDGIIAFERERWTEAKRIFSEVQSMYPYSTYAPLSLLRSADSSFGLGSHAEAAVEYQHFLKTYPTHPEAHHAAYKKAQSYYKQIPSNFFLFPPNHERDQTATKDARIALAHFIRSYPESDLVPQAKKLHRNAESLLIRHEMYVARFYLSKQKRNAAAVRLESVREQYPNSKKVADTMFLQAITFLEMGKQKNAIETFQKIIEHYPGHYQAIRSKAYLDVLKSQKGSSADNG